MAKFKVTYSEIQSHFIIVEADTAEQAEARVDDFLGGESLESFAPERGRYYEYTLDDVDQL